MVEPCPNFVPPIIAIVGILLIALFFVLVIALFRQRRWIALKNAMNQLIIAYNPNEMTFAAFSKKLGINPNAVKTAPKDALEFALLSLAEGSVKRQ